MKLRFYNLVYSFAGALLHLPAKIRYALLVIRAWAWTKTTAANLEEINARISRRHS